MCVYYIILQKITRKNCIDSLMMIATHIHTLSNNILYNITI